MDAWKGRDSQQPSDKDEPGRFGENFSAAFFPKYPEHDAAMAERVFMKKLGLATCLLWPRRYIEAWGLQYPEAPK